MARIAWVVLCVLVTACDCGTRTDPSAALPLQPCRIAGIGRLASCGWISVPEDRRADDGHGANEAGTIRVRVVRVAAPSRARAASALVLLAGGPGQASSEIFPEMWHSLAAIAGERDVVMIDQRGTGQSAPLDCPESNDLAEIFRPGALADAARGCLGQMRGRNLDAYSTAASADDIEAVVVALGYPQIDLLGISYGTRLAMAYAARYPERTRTLVLDALVPPEFGIGSSFGRDAQTALDGVLRDCAQDPACARAFPDARDALLRYLEDLSREPRNVEVRHPKSAQPTRLTVSRDGFAGALRGFLYAPELVALLPLSLASVERGDFEGFVAQAAMLAESAAEHVSLGLLLSIVCAEDVPRITAAGVGAEEQSLFGAALLQELRLACRHWPVRPRPLAPIAAPIAAPALLLSGALDPVTPPRWGDVAMRHLPHGKHVVVPQAAHGVWARGCVPRLLARFLDAAKTDALDASCAAKHRRPPFFIDVQGPAE